MKNKLFKSRRNFTSETGKRFSAMQRISEAEYLALPENEQRFFSGPPGTKQPAKASSNESERRNDHISGSTSPTPGIGDMLGTGLPGGIDLDFSTPF